MRRKHGWFVLLLLILLLQAGCQWQDMQTRIQSMKESLNTDQKNETEMLVEDVMKDAPLDQAEKTTVQLYFPTKSGGGLGIEERSIDRVDGIGRAAVTELLKGPKSDKMVSPFPTGVQLLDINIRPDGQCFVNFNARIQDIDGAAREKNAVYSIVDTLSQFPTVDEVNFLVEGEKVDSLAGNIDLSVPVAANYEMVKADSR